MKIKHHEIEIPEDFPFANCKLGREPYARVLTSIVYNQSEGFVLAINNEWGAGKTTFVRMWQQQLKIEGFQTIYFNAWENDFEKSPLVAILSELEGLSFSKKSQDFKSVIEKGAVLAKRVAPVLAKSLLKKYVLDVDDVILASVESITKSSFEILEQEIKDYSERKNSINSFRTELENFIKDSKNDRPLIFIVDELDRCRPDYSVEVLEHIKHLFSVSGIVFVLSIDKNHLASAVRGFYGSEQIDTNEYLRRFIDLEYSIPFPQAKSFNEYLFEYYQFDEFFSSTDRLKFTNLRGEAPQLLKISGLIFAKNSATLRQQERVFSLTRLVLYSFTSNEYTFPNLLFILVYYKTMRNDVFQKIERNEFTLQELSDLVFETIYSEKLDFYGIDYLSVESIFLWFYNNDRDAERRERLIAKNELNQLTTPINSKLEKYISGVSLVTYFDAIARQYEYDSLPLNSLLKRINMTEPVRML